MTTPIEAGTRRGLWACSALALAAAAIIAVPFVWLLCAAFKQNSDLLAYPFLPGGDGVLGVAWDRLTLEHFRGLVREAGIGRALLTSVVLASVTAVLATLNCAMSGYALASLEFAGKRVVSKIVLLAVVVPPPLLIAPGFQVLFRLGLLDHLAGLILPAIAPAFGVYLFRQATLASVPKDLVEAARMDACGEIRLFFKVVLPLIQPMVAAFLLVVFLGTWNNFLSPQVVLQSPDKMPLAVKIAQLKNVYYQDYGLLMAGTVASILPVAALFLFLQRDFVSGLTSGAVKG